MRSVQRIDGLSCVVYDEVPQHIIDVVESRFPGMGAEVSLRSHLPLQHCLDASQIVGVFTCVQIMIGDFPLDIFPTLGDAMMALEEQLKKHQASILAEMPPVITPSAHVMTEVRGMVERMFGPGRELACHFVWRGAGGADGWFSRGYKFVYGEVKFNEGPTVEDAVKDVRAMYREWLNLRISGVLRGRKC